MTWFRHQTKVPAKCWLLCRFLTSVIMCNHVNKEVVYNWDQLTEIFKAQVMSGIKSQIQTSWWEDVTDVGQKKNKWQGQGNLNHFPPVSTRNATNTCKQTWHIWVLKRIQQEFYDCSILCVFIYIIELQKQIRLTSIRSSDYLGRCSGQKNERKL